MGKQPMAVCFWFQGQVRTVDPEDESSRTYRHGGVSLLSQAKATD